MGNLDVFLDNLQQKIFKEVKEVYREKGYQRWCKPLCHVRLPGADAHARVTGTYGDTMEIYLKFENDCISQASYFTDGNSSSAIYGPFAAELALQKNPDALMNINGESVLKMIGRLPQEVKYCTDLASAAVQEALSNCMKQSRK